MADWVIPTDLAEKIEEIAVREQRSVEEVLARMVEQYAVRDAPPSDAAGVPPRGTLARLAYEALRGGFDSGDPDLVDKSREILNTEFPNHLSKRPV